MNSILIDTHCHLNIPPLGDDPDAVLRRAAAAGVDRVVVPAYDLAGWPGILALTGRSGVYAALGLHPWVADQIEVLFPTDQVPAGGHLPGVEGPPAGHIMLTPQETGEDGSPTAPPGGHIMLTRKDEMDRGRGPDTPEPDNSSTPDQENPPQLDQSSSPQAPADPLDRFIHHLRDTITAHRNRIVAIGEIGLDTKVASPALPIQQQVLAAQLQLAVELDLPVILHCRGAFDELLAAVAEHQGRLRGVLHAFSGSLETARRCLDAGLHLGLGGAVTRPNARRVRRAAADLPLERIVLETDAPSIGLDGILPEQAEPAHVALVAQALARLRGQDLAEIATVTTANAVSLFKITPSFT